MDLFKKQDNSKDLTLQLPDGTCIPTYSSTTTKSETKSGSIQDVFEQFSVASTKLDETVDIIEVEEPPQSEKYFGHSATLAVCSYEIGTYGEFVPSLEHLLHLSAIRLSQHHLTGIRFHKDAPRRWTFVFDGDWRSPPKGTYVREPEDYVDVPPQKDIAAFHF